MQATTQEPTAVRLDEAPADNLPGPIIEGRMPARADQPRLVQLAQGLAKARAHCKPVEKDSVNSHHGYAYASAEAILSEARTALDQGGLVLIPVHQSINGHQDKGEHRYELYRKFLLLHSSGECLPLDCHWPVVVERGRPLDKAAAIADTLSLAYLLRDLLQMPRVDAADDVAAQDDRPRQQAGQQQQQAKKEPADADAIKHLREWSRYYCIPEEDVAAEMRVEKLEQLNLESCREAMRRLKGVKIMRQRADRIARRLEQTGKTATAAVQYVGLAADAQLMDLTNEQADRLEQAMEPKGKKAS